MNRHTWPETLKVQFLQKNKPRPFSQSNTITGDSDRNFSVFLANKQEREKERVDALAICLLPSMMVLRGGRREVLQSICLTFEFFDKGQDRNTGVEIDFKRMKRAIIDCDLSRQRRGSITVTVNLNLTVTVDLGNYTN